MHTHHSHPPETRDTGDTIVATLTIGIKPATRNAGVCVSIDDTPLEAVTVEAALAIPKPAKGADGKATPGNPVALVDTTILTGLAANTIQTALDIIDSHSDTITAACGAGARPVWCIEALVPGRRAAVARGRVLEAVIAQSINQGAFSALLVGEDVVWVPSPDAEAYTAYPEPLTGAKPTAWRGRRGSDRGQQQAAWAISQAGLASRGHHTPEPGPVAPAAPVLPSLPTRPALATPAGQVEYVTTLRVFVRDSLPDTFEDLMAAANTALATYVRPEGVRVITAHQLAFDALDRVGVAPHLNIPIHRTYLQEQIKGGN